MGVKSTKTITRAQAEARYTDLAVRLKADKRRDKQQELIEAADHIPLPYFRGRDLSEIDQETMLEIYHHVDAQLRYQKWRTQARHEVIEMNDTELENKLERVNDEAHGGEGFENYIISDKSED